MPPPPDAAPPDAGHGLAGDWRFAKRTLWLAGVLALCLPPHLLWRAMGWPSPWARTFLGLAARACGARVTVVGTPLRHDVFYVANHLSWIDICILGGETNTAFVSQDKIRDWPVIGILARLNHTVFVSRTDRMAVAEQIAELRAALAERQPVTIFPEGTTTDGGSLLPFKSALFEVLLPLPRALMIQPVLLEFDRMGRGLAWIGEEGAAANARRVFARQGSFDVRVHFLEPFDPAAYPGRKAISAEARRRIAAALSAVLGTAVT